MRIGELTFCRECSIAPSEKIVGDDPNTDLQIYELESSSEIIEWVLKGSRCTSCKLGVAELAGHCRQCRIDDYLRTNANPSTELEIYKFRPEYVRWMVDYYLCTSCGEQSSDKKCRGCVVDEFVRDNPDPSTATEKYLLTKWGVKWVLDYYIGACHSCNIELRTKIRDTLCSRCATTCNKPHIKMEGGKMKIKCRVKSERRHRWKVAVGLVPYDYRCTCSICTK